MPVTCVVYRLPELIKTIFSSWLREATPLCLTSITLEQRLAMLFKLFLSLTIVMYRWPVWDSPVHVQDRREEPWRRGQKCHKQQPRQHHKHLQGVQVWPHTCPSPQHLFSLIWTFPALATSEPQVTAVSYFQKQATSCIHCASQSKMYKLTPLWVGRQNIGHITPITLMFHIKSKH